MKLARSVGRSWSRRAFLGGCSLLRVSAASRKGRVFPPESTTYQDPSTEFRVTRLTDPAHTSHLPDPSSRFLSRKRNHLYYASDRPGTMQAFRLDLGKDKHRQLTQASDLDHRSLTLYPNEKRFAYFDGRKLLEAGTGSLRTRLLYEIADGFDRGEGLTISDDGRRAVVAETGDGRSRLRLIDVQRRKASTVVEADGILSDPLLRPRHRSILYRGADGRLWLANQDGTERRRLATAPGKIGPVFWDSWGRAVLYLSLPARGGGHSIRELFPEGDQDHLLAEAGQFVTFGPNANASVFVGAQGARATPHVSLLLRVGREFTICEHRASDPSGLITVFAPDSRRIFFSSDRDGKSAIYTMDVHDLVESTDDKQAKRVSSARRY